MSSGLRIQMGGALLQGIDRDTQKFAMKCSAAQINGVWIPLNEIKSNNMFEDHWEIVQWAIGS